MWPAKPRNASLLVVLSDRLLWLFDSKGPSATTRNSLEVPILSLDDDFSALGAALASLARQLAAALEAQRDPPFNVLISERWMVCDIVPWSDALMGHEARHYVFECLRNAGYRVDSNSVLQVDDQLAGEPCWAACFSGDLITVLQSFAKQLKQTLHACVPLNAALCSDLVRNKRIEGPIGILDGVWLRLYQLNRRACLPIGGSLPVVDSQSLALIWQRIRLTYAGIQHPERFKLVCLATESDATAFSVPIIPMSSSTEEGDGLSWFRLVFDENHPLSYRLPLKKGLRYVESTIVALLLVLCGLLVWGLGEVEAEIASRLETTRAAGVVSLLQTNIPPAGDVLSPRAIALLNFSIEESLRPLIPPDSAAVYLLGVEFNNEAAPSIVRVTGQTKTLDDVAGYLSHLAANSRVDHAELLRHEKVPDNLSLPLRFELQVTWRN